MKRWLSDLKSQAQVKGKSVNSISDGTPLDPSEIAQVSGADGGVTFYDFTRSNADGSISFERWRSNQQTN